MGLAQMLVCFNPHTHTGCDQALHSSLAIRPSFNPHTHTGCDIRLPWHHPPVDVSIHTPIQGVTHILLALCNVSRVSIHTPIQGVTLFALTKDNVIRGFNPHTHTGCDYFHRNNEPRHSCFNPHTHTGCDSRTGTQRTPRWSFNPHTHTGCDLHILDQGVSSDVSIHTPIQGVTKYIETLGDIEMFQSTHPYRV